MYTNTLLPNGSIKNVSELTNILAFCKSLVAETYKSKSYKQLILLDILILKKHIDVSNSTKDVDFQAH